ncbi:MAG: LuxR C-terminal-related transcriptional regulator, partial [Proteobacteria bacterium]|nr:LuxR C-terminal-related transcriptional regulator [Pseudomonadota bacterium]
TQEFGFDGQLSAAKIAATSLINGVDSIAEEITLILEEYDRITDQWVHDILAFLLLHAPSNLHLILSTRCEPPLPFAYLRAGDQLIEIGAENLRFGIEESRSFLADNCSVKLSARQMRTLHDATEGWVTGLQIAAIGLRGRSSPDELIARFSGSFRTVTEYLAQNVLPSLSPEAVAFLLRTSILRNLSGALCEHVSGIAGGQRTLEWLAAQNMFLKALDDEGEWYRYHPLFADFLRFQMERQGSDDVRLLHQRAAEWLSEHQMWAEAVQHALAADRLDLATDWVERCAMKQIEDSDVSSVLTWIRKLPQEAIRQRLRLHIAFAWALTLTNQAEEAQQVFSDIEQRIAAGEHLVSDEIRWGLETLRATITILIKDDTASALALALQCQKAQPARSEWIDDKLWTRQIIRNILSLGYEKAGNLDLARAAQTDMNDHLPIDFSRSLFAVCYGYCLLGACDVREGLLENGARQFRRTLGIAEARVGRRSAAASLAASYLAELHYEWDELDEVEELLADRIDVIDEACILDSVKHAHLALARMYIVRADFDAAHGMLDRAEILGKQRAWPRLVAACSAERARLWLLQNNRGEAERALRRLEAIAPAKTPRTPSAASETQRFLLLTQARLLLDARSFDEAAVVLRKTAVLDKATGAAYAALKTRALYAVAINGKAEHQAALGCLQAVLKDGQAANIIRSIIDEASFVAPLLDEVLSSPSARPVATRDYCGRLGMALGRHRKNFATPAAAGTRPAPAAHATLDSLSLRERDILDLVAKGLSNKQISRSLLITTETVKWHLKNIFSKLDVTRRTQAVHQARKLEILD